MHENGLRRGSQRFNDGAERLALVVRRACGFEDASVGGDETLEPTIVSVIIRLGRLRGVPGLQVAGQTWGAECAPVEAVDGKVQEANGSRPFAPVKRRSRCEAAVDRPSVAADVGPCSFIARVVVDQGQNPSSYR